MTHTLIFAAIMALIVLGAFYAGLKIGINRNLTVKAMAGNLVGSLIINETDPDQELMSLQLECTLGEVISKDYVILTIKNESSQEKPVV